MAPKRSGGGSGGWSSSSSNTCPDAFSYWTSQANLAYFILFLIMYIGIFFGLCVVTKRSGAGKKLIGPVYILSLLFTIASLALDLINLVMTECEVQDPVQYDNVAMASTILYHLSVLGLLFVVFYKLNSMLRKKLGSVVMAFKVIPLAIFGVMGAVYVAYVALSSYVYSSGVYYYEEAEGLADSTQKISLAARVLYLLCVLASTVLAAMTISALRRAHLPGGDLIGGVTALHTFMLLWAILAVALMAISNYYIELPLAASFALSYVLTFFQALSFLALLGIAKHICWRDNSGPTQQVFVPVMHEQAAYSYGNGAQAYHHEPEYVGHAK